MPAIPRSRRLRRNARLALRQLFFGLTIFTVAFGVWCSQFADSDSASQSVVQRPGNSASVLTRPTAEQAITVNAAVSTTVDVTVNAAVSTAVNVTASRSQATTTVTHRPGPVSLSGYLHSEPSLRAPPLSFV